MIFPLHFHYEDVLRQDLLLKLNYASVMEVPGLFEIRLVPYIPVSALSGEPKKSPKEIPGTAAQKHQLRRKGDQFASVASCFLASIRILGKLAIEILCGQRFIHTERGPEIQAGKCFRSNRSEEKEETGVSDFARQSALRGHGMSNFLVRILTVIPILDSPVEIREKSIQFSMEREFCEFSPELKSSFEIFEHIRGFNVTILTSAKTKDETLVLWNGFLLKD